MAAKKGNGNWLGYVLAGLGGAALGYLLAKALSGGMEHYNCPNCNNLFEGKLTMCPYCNALFTW